MIFVHKSKVRISENRQRRVFDKEAQQELSTSIQKIGLMHPLVTRPDPDQADSFILVAGERRSRSIDALHELDIPFLVGGQRCPKDHYPVLTMNELSPLQAEEAELDENLRRKNLTWQEEAAAIARLSALTQAKSDWKAQETGVPQPKVTHTAVAALIVEPGKAVNSGDVAKVSEAVVLAKHLDNPEVAKAKTASEAMKILKKQAKAEHREKLAAEFDPTKTPHVLVEGDSREWLKSLPDGVFDLILTDPPYGVGADSFGDMSGTGHNYEDTPAYSATCYDSAIQEGFRIAKPNATMYLFCTIELWASLKLTAQLAGWTVWPRPLIWNKLGGMLPKPDYGPRYTYEAILFATKGDKKLERVGAPDVLTYPVKGDLEHGAQKPVDLYADLIARSCLPGAKVIDPFAGSGTIFPAANKAKVEACGCELVRENYILALSRMNETSNLTDLLKGIPQ